MLLHAEMHRQAGTPPDRCISVEKAVTLDIQSLAVVCADESIALDLVKPEHAPVHRIAPLVVVVVVAIDHHHDASP
jgi:hypothetical protein